MDKKFYKINRQITAPTIRLLSADGKQIGVVSLSEALRQSQDTGLDLVEIDTNKYSGFISLANALIPTAPKKGLPTALENREIGIHSPLSLMAF